MSYVNITNMSGIVGVFDYANVASDGVFGLGVVVGLFFILLLNLNREGEFCNALIASGFITSVSGVFLFLLGLISGKYLFICVTLMVVAGIWAYIHKAG